MKKQRRRTFGTIKDCGNGTFQIRYPTLNENGLPGKRKLETFYGTYSEAESLLKTREKEYRADKDRAEHKNEVGIHGLENIKPATITVDEAWNKVYLPHAQVEVSTLAGYTSVYRKHIAPKFGHRRMMTITHREIQNLIDATSHGRAKHLVAVLRILWNAVEYEGLMRYSDNIMRGRYKISHTKDNVIRKQNARVYSESEMNKIIDECDDTFLKGLLSVLGKGALRVGEVCGLKCGDVSFQDHDGNTWCIIDIKRNVLKVDGQLIEKTTKTEKSKRLCVIPFPWSSYVYTVWTTHKREQDWLFDDGIGNPMTADSLRTIWTRYALEKGIPYIPLKNFRNSCATTMRANGVPEGDVVNILGHTTSEMLRTHYNRPGAEELISAYTNIAGKRNETEELKEALHEANELITQLQEQLQIALIRQL